MGGAVGDYNNDGWPDMVITCLGHTILYRNNGDGTFTDVSKQAGIDDPGGPPAPPSATTTTTVSLT